MKQSRRKDSPSFKAKVALDQPCRCLSLLLTKRAPLYTGRFLGQNRYGSGGCNSGAGVTQG